VELGREFTIDKGSFEGQKRLEFDYITVHIKTPDKGDLLPQVNPVLGFPNPVADDYLDNYLPYLMTDEEKEGESYTYGQRICAGRIDHMVAQDLLNPIVQENFNELVDLNIIKGGFVKRKSLATINQMELMIWMYKNHGHRNNQMIMQVGAPGDMYIDDPPCLRAIDTRIQDGKLHFFPYFRSWDLFGGFPANLAGIEMMKQYCAEQIGVENGEIIASSKGLHVYDYVWEIAEAIRGKSMEEFRGAL
jgi:thymidylate synthase